MTPPTPKLCACGCNLELQRTVYPSGKLEALTKFAEREYVSLEHYRLYKSRMAALDRLHTGRKPQASTKRSLERMARRGIPGPLQIGAMDPHPLDPPVTPLLLLERQAAEPRPEPSDGEIMALLKVCLELHEPLLECWEEAAQAALPVRRVPRAATSRARCQA